MDRRRSGDVGQCGLSEQGPRVAPGLFVSGHHADRMVAFPERAGCFQYLLIQAVVATASQLLHVPQNVLTVDRRTESDRASDFSREKLVISAGKS